MSSHTPGPWFVDRTQDGAAWTGSLAIGSLDGGHVCHTTRDVAATSLADATLIAAAPELLGALRLLLADGGPLSDPISRKRAGDRARAAIANAEGRS